MRSWPERIVAATLCVTLAAPMLLELQHKHMGGITHVDCIVAEDVHDHRSAYACVVFSEPAAGCVLSA